MVELDLLPNRIDMERRMLSIDNESNNEEQTRATNKKIA